MFIKILEIFTLVAGIFYVWLQIKQSRWTWPFDIVVSAASIVVFASGHIWASMVLNIYYLVMGVCGTIAWKKDAEKASEGALRLRKLPRKELLASILLLLVGSIGAYFILRALADPAPLLDGIVAVSSIIGTYWLLRSYLENWLLWIFSDLVSTILCLSQGMYWMALMYTAYTAAAVIGWMHWKKQGEYII